MTLEIISNSVTMMVRNFSDYLKASIPFVTFAVIEYILFGVPYQEDSNYIISLMHIYLATDFIIKIHRFTIIQDKDFFSFKIVSHLKYIFAVFIISLFLFLIPITISLNIASTGAGIFFIVILPFIFIIYFLPYVLFFPMIAIEKRQNWIDFKNHISGFRLTLILQTLLVILIYLIASLPHLLFITAPPKLHLIFGSVMYFFISIFSIILLSETYKTWNNQQNT